MLPQCPRELYKGAPVAIFVSDPRLCETTKIMMSLGCCNVDSVSEIDHLHQVSTNPIVENEPIVIQNVAKYRTLFDVTTSSNLFGDVRCRAWWSTTVEPHMYPTPATKQDAAIIIPRLCSLSDAYDVRKRTTAATAYGGTVSSCARAFAEDTLALVKPPCAKYPLNPNVMMMVGRNAVIPAVAQSPAKYTTAIA